ncbi:hypothetical protein DRM22_20140 [Salmonella enterica subsp. enterica serovar Glostrup]|nr:hypothetical protein [Salmonella enterica subsp. enterica serovar Glostrup]ECA5087176.1 hypothetical protein [Salmonella enterica subsp. enterica serovar Menston]EDD8385153.1 hypothetical protein [Salmonella enterica subsp. enterica serovar Schwarzengrund]EDW4490146.1 hypothetical protein [Salmonella enterica subsp. enterica]
MQIPDVVYQLLIAILYKNIIIMFMYEHFFSWMIMLFNFAGQSYSAGYEKRGCKNSLHKYK